MHHAPNEVDPEMAKKLKEFYKRGEVGPTGKFPEGKLTKKDEGEYRFMMAVVKNKVVMNFGKPIAWIAMDRDEAFRVARALRKHAKKIT